MTEIKTTKIPQRQECVNKEHPYIGGAKDIIDDELGKPQSEVNQNRIEDIAVETQRATQTEGILDGKIATEKQRAEVVEGGLNTRLQTVEQLAEISIGGGDAQIATASDFDNPDATKRAKIPTVGAVLDGISEGVFNLTAKTGDSYASLQDALTAANTAIPANKKKGGMQLSFVLSSDNKYVQWRLTTPSWSTDPNDWVAENEDFRNEVMQEVNDAIEANTPIVVEGDVNNAPDEEDLTSVNQDGTNVLKFKDKAYTPLTYSGMGRVYLRKNMVNGVNTLTQDMFYKGEAGSRVPNTNTIYVIQYNFTLGEDITVPANCVLEFDGGSISAGNGENMNTITGNNTYIPFAESIFKNIKIAGTWNVPVISTMMWIQQTDVLFEIEHMLNDNIMNTVYVYDCTVDINNAKRGETTGARAGMRIGSNVNMQILGTITSNINESGVYEILQIGQNKHNVEIHGGIIIGDKLIGPSTRGDMERGHGISTSPGSYNIIIDGVEVYNCWGDSLYLYASQQIVQNCKLHDSRRQGISILAGEEVIIQNNEIYNISGTSPEACIDMEPNAGYGGIRNIIVENNYFHDSVAGVGTSKASGSSDELFENILFRNNDFYNLQKGIGGYGFGQINVVYERNIIHNCVQPVNAELMNLLLKENIIYNNSGDIHLEYCGNVVFDGNNIDFAIPNYGAGLYFLATEGKLVLKNNTIKGLGNYLEFRTPAIDEENYYIDIDVYNNIIEKVYFGFHTYTVKSSTLKIKNNVIRTQSFVVRTDTNEVKCQIENNSIYKNNGDGNVFIFDGVTGVVRNNHIDTENWRILSVLQNKNCSFIDNEIFGYTITTPENLIFSGTVSPKTFRFLREDIPLPGIDIPRTEGTTKPTLSTNDVGFMFFDTSSNKLSIWNGTAWVDATGAPV